MTNDIDERLTKRFGNAQTDQNDGKEQKAQNAQNGRRSQNERNDRKERKERKDQPERESQNDQKEQNAQNAQNAQNIKKEWKVRSFYLDDELDARLTTAFKRLDLELAEADASMHLKKTRHFYPLVVRLGLDRLEAMDPVDVLEHLTD